MEAQDSANRLLARNAGLVRAFFARRAPSPEEAEDLFQEACCAILSGAPRFRGGSAESTWVWAVCRHVWAGWTRRRDRERRLAGLLQCATVVQAGLPVGPAEAAGAGQTDAIALAAAMERLSPALREIYAERFVKGRGVKEIAARLDLPEGTVKWRLSELRRRVARELEG